MNKMNPPEYGYDQSNDHQILAGQGRNAVMMGQPGAQQTIIIQSPAARPSSYLGLAIFVTICCNLLFGIIAIIFSVMSSSAADDGNMEQARSHGKVSMGLSIAGILISIVISVALIVYFTVVVTKTVNDMCDEVGGCNRENVEKTINQWGNN